MKILIDDRIPFIRGVFEPHAEVEYVSGAAMLPAHVRHASALVVRTRTQCNAALLRGSSVQLIASATIGHDHIDDAFCSMSGIAWANAAGCNSGAVEQYATAALLELASRRNVSLRGKTLGIVGVGNVGRRMLRVAQALGMRALQNDPPRQRAEGAGSFVALHELAAQSDVVTVHVPLSREGADKTFHLINAGFFAHLKRGALFINTSRGEVVDEAALKSALHQGLPAGAALDVWEHEPNIDAELLRMVDVGTPHVAGYSAEGKATATQMAVRAVAAFFGLPLQRWQPAPFAPPEKADVAVDCKSKSVQEILHTLARETYPILLDDAALRNAPAEGEALRGAYRYRREFTAYRPLLRHATAAQRAAIAQVFPAIG